MSIEGAKTVAGDEDAAGRFRFVQAGEKDRGARRLLGFEPHPELVELREFFVLLGDDGVVDAELLGEVDRHRQPDVIPIEGLGKSEEGEFVAKQSAVVGREFDHRAVSPRLRGCGDGLAGGVVVGRVDGKGPWPKKRVAKPVHDNGGKLGAGEEARLGVDVEVAIMRASGGGGRPDLSWLVRRMRRDAPDEKGEQG